MSAAKSPRKNARSAAQPLLVELRTEELPPKSLARLAEEFARAVAEGLCEAALVSAEDAARVEAFATPRRLAVRVGGVLSRQPDQWTERRGPAVAVALDAEGKPTPALVGFARSCGTAPERLERRRDAKGEYFLFRSRRRGEPLAKRLPAIVERALARLPVAKRMRWGEGEAEFVRPLHDVVMLHGRRVVPGTVLGVKSGRRTRGHRFLARGAIAIPHALRYEKTLAERGRVLVSFAERRERIAQALDRAARKAARHASWRHSRDAELLDETTGLVEWPAVYCGGFDERFLEVPPECLTLSMQRHQRYFPLFGKDGKLLPRFLIVSNLPARDPSGIVRGNERVLRARLADAKFFYDQDRKERLEARVPRLAAVVYQHRLGSQLERTERLRRLAAAIAPAIGADAEAAARAALLSKADLLTGMVGEFPELQGVIGRYYALADGESREVADAIEQHYRPRFAGDALPEGAVARALALADKLDTLAGLFGVGERPTGEKDPFGLRRAALGVVRILAEHALALKPLIEQAVGGYPQGALRADTAEEVFAFCLDRLRSHLREQGFSVPEIESVLGEDPQKLDSRVALLLERVRAVQSFRRLPQAEQLAAANKRIRNILRQARFSSDGLADPSLFVEDAERELHREIAGARAEVESRFDARDYRGSLAALARLRPVVDRFFDQVLVNAEDPRLRANRLRLLGELDFLMNRVADISRLAVEK